MQQWVISEKKGWCDGTCLSRSTHNKNMREENKDIR